MELVYVYSPYERDGYLFRVPEFAAPTVCKLLSRNGAFIDYGGKDQMLGK
jgi:hypothetical protein